MTQEITDDLIELLKSVDEPMVEIRHDLHAHPELAFNENYTTRLINDRLVALYGNRCGRRTSWREARPARHGARRH
jgi:metal-dependent amidase/aminoacylase/carboxypeptidase family protein